MKIRAQNNKYLILDMEISTILLQKKLLMAFNLVLDIKQGCWLDKYLIGGGFTYFQG